MNNCDKLFTNYHLANILHDILHFKKYNSLSYITVSDWLIIKNIYLILGNNSKRIRAIEHIREKYENDEKKDKIIQRETINQLYELSIDVLESISTEYKNNNTTTSQIENKLNYIVSSLGMNEHHKTLLTISLIVFMYDLYEIGLTYNDNYMNCIRTLSVIFGFNKQWLIQTLNSSNILYTAHIFENLKVSNVFSTIEMNHRFAKSIINPNIKPEMLFEGCFSIEKERGMSMSNFSHMATDTQIISDIIKNALKNNLKGVNILLTGRAGSGKSLYARSLIRSLNLKQINIHNHIVDKNKNAEKEGITSAEIRLGFYNVAQSIHKNSNNSVIVFDECDMILNTKDTFSDNKVDKAPLIDAMDKSTIPTIYIANGIDECHEAVLRRFSFSKIFGKLENTASNKIIRKAYKRYHLGNEVPDNILKFINTHEMSLGESSLAFKRISEMVANGISEEEMKKRLTVIIERMVSLRKKREITIQADKDTSMKHYDIQYLNTDTDAKDVINAIRNFDSLQKKKLALPVLNMNLMFYGCSGTGKSEFARYIAQAVGKKIIIKNPSDIYSKYLGETEVNLAEAFKLSEETGSILVFDEAENYFQKRENAVRQWEVSQVNEVLNAMERFHGILICTTNMISSFDNAAIRRFSHKIFFSFMKPEQKALAAKNIFGSIVKRDELEYLCEEVQRIENLSIGDYRTVYQKIIYDTRISPNKILEHLRAEVNIKNYSTERHIGFGSNK